MQQQLISLSPDLKRLQDEGYEIEIRSGHLLIHSVPYVNSRREVALGTLVSVLSLSGDITIKPACHICCFVGEHPCTSQGNEIEQIKHQSQPQILAENIAVDHSFSNKPAEGYTDYYEKMTRYIAIISHHAAAIDPTSTPCTFKVIQPDQNSSPFSYMDTASSRAGIAAVSMRLATPKIAIIGLGGTGSYILDLVAKTPVGEIHLYDGDIFVQHNAFRSPGAASIDDLSAKPNKAEYFKSIYSRMHKGIVSHNYYLTEESLDFTGFSFVFICVDKGRIKASIIENLKGRNISFIDVGIGVQLLENSQQLLGICRVTTGSASKFDHLDRRINFNDVDNNAYVRNIQIADLNALNASLAVIKWKKLCGFYQDLEGEHDSTYSINVNQLTSDELA
jgi:hypothetical protein